MGLLLKTRKQAVSSPSLQYGRAPEMNDRPKPQKISLQWFLHYILTTIKILHYVLLQVHMSLFRKDKRKFSPTSTFQNQQGYLLDKTEYVCNLIFKTRLFQVCGPEPSIGYAIQSIISTFTNALNKRNIASCKSFV